MTAHIDVAVCERLIDSAIRSCPIQPSLPLPAAVPPVPDWNPIANSLAALSAAFAWGTFVLAVVALMAGVAWSYLFKGWARKIAKSEAEEVARERISQWLATDAPALIREHIENLQSVSVGDKLNGDAADTIGKDAG